MVLHLTSDLERIKHEYDLTPTESMLFSAIRLDSQPLVAPIIAQVRSDGDDLETSTAQQWLLVRQQEQGNVLSAGVPKEKIKLYEPWMTLDPRVIQDSPASTSLLEAVKEISGTDPVSLGGEVPLKHYQALSAELSVSVEKSADEAAVAYEVDLGENLDRFAGWRERGVAVARDVISHVEHLEGLAAEFQAAQDTRYSLLEAIADSQEVDGVLIGAAPNFSEVTGFPVQRGCYALWIQSSRRLVVLAPEHITNINLRPIGRYASVSQAIESLTMGKNLGVEEEWIPSSMATTLESTGMVLHSFSKKLGHWRDVRDHEDLPFQVIAARASVYAIEEALSWADIELTRGAEFTERDLYDVYREKLVNFRVTHQIPFAIEPYFTNLHSSNRMLFPGPPVDFPLNDDTTCIQLDAGVSITINGVVLATSDMARSLPRVPEAIEAYNFFFDVVREGIIGQIRPGVVCEDVHEATLEYLAPHLERMREIGMLGNEVDFNTEYRKRNVGHLMGKQESFANELRPGYKHVLREGSYGAAEIPWRYNRAAIGTEDLWYVGERKTYILTMR